MIAAFAAPQVVHLLIGFLVLIIVLAIIWGLLYCIETWIHPIPPPVKLVLAIIILLLVVIWAVSQFMPLG